MEKEESIENNKLNDAAPIAYDSINNSNNLNMNQNNDNTFNNINIINYNKVELNKHIININLSDPLIKNLTKDYLIDLILFLKNFCQMTIEEKDANFNHDFFKIEKNINNINEYLITVRYDENKKDNNQNKNINNIKVNNNYNFEEEKNNDIINESKEKQNNNGFSKIYKHFICYAHNREFKTKKDYEKHCQDTHKFKCQKCNKFFGSKGLFNKHLCINKINVNDINEINKNDEYNKIKKLQNNNIKYFENDLIHNNYELIDAHNENKKEEEENKEYKKLNGVELDSLIIKENQSNEKLEEMNSNEYYYNIWKKKKKKKMTVN